MPGMCSVPGCKGYRKARSRGVVFHSLPTRDPGRCRKWLKAIQNPKFDENTPVSKYGNIRVCSQHFKPEDYEPDIQAELMKTTPRKILKSHVIPSVFSGRQQEDVNTSLPADDSSRTEAKAPSTAAQASSSVVSCSSIDSVLERDSVLTSIATGAPSTSSQSPPPAELSKSLCNIASVDRLREQKRETELNSTVTSKSNKNTESDLSQSKTIVNDSCLMELFKKCQTCGQPISKKNVSHCGAQKMVRWSCLGGHRGTWMSSPHLWEAFPEIHVLTALSILFSGGTFTHFKKWAKHLHLNFMGHKTFFEIQKAYLNPEMKQMHRTKQEEIFTAGVHQQCSDDTLLHISGPLKSIRAYSRRREKGVLSSWSSYEMKSSISLTSTGTCMDEPPARSSAEHVSRGKQDDVDHQSDTTLEASEVNYLQDSCDEMDVAIDENSMKNRLSDLDSDIEKVAETSELSGPGADDSCDEEVYVPTIPQRHLSTKSELLLECEEEELEPWQKQTSHARLKEGDDNGELSNDQADCSPEPSLLQRNTSFIGASPRQQLTSNAELIGSLGTQCRAGNSFTVLPASKKRRFRNVATTTVKQEACDEIIDNQESLSGVRSPAVCGATSSNQLPSDLPNSQTSPVNLSLPSFAEHEHKSTAASSK
ncbi:uncharacterized protein LOC115580887 [Sparus aurata]|uniref:Uncharacterized LOC115580887 n=1 Tax=Sparus aurata TaxID=8175 RepID=A0A671YLH9_SPAAU|nr:uncharacterized protein LOC115580887 [Sparus aurata]